MYEKNVDTTLDCGILQRSLTIGGHFEKRSISSKAGSSKSKAKAEEQVSKVPPEENRKEGFQ
jgi:hypothetical protein